MKYSVSDLIYKGKETGVHGWNTPGGPSFYWHPDWLHVAEDMTGHNATAHITPSKGKIDKSDAENAIVKHLNKSS